MFSFRMFKKGNSGDRVANGDLETSLFEVARSTREDAADYHSDRPMDNPDQDRFRRWPFALRLAQTISARTDPASLVVGVYGGWGEGKTTVLNFVQRALNGVPNVVCVRFNPWRYESEDTLLRQYFEHLATALNTSVKSRKRRFGSQITALGRVVPPIKISPASTVGSETIGAEIDVGKAIRTFGENLSSASLEQEKEHIGELLVSKGVRVIVFIDDIDRLDKAEVQSVFRLVKLTADFANTVFVLALDPDIVARALGERYSAESSGAGFSFLDKIVQVPLHLPTVPPLVLRQYCFAAVDAALSRASIRLSNDEVQRFVTAFHGGLEPAMATPRIANRYSNILSFSLPLLKGEVNPVDLMLIEGMRLVYPDLYAAVRRNKDFWTNSRLLQLIAADEKSYCDEVLENALRLVRANDRGSASTLLSYLFPRVMARTGLTGYRSRRNPESAQAIETEEYFDRYFSYTVPEGDVSDKAVDSIIEHARRYASDDALILFSTETNSQVIDSVLTKLGRREAVIDEVAAVRLARAIANIGDKLPDPPGNLGFTPRRRAAAFVGVLLGRIPSAELRAQVAMEILSVAEPFEFAFHCLDVMRRSGEEEEDSRPSEGALFSRDEAERLGAQLAARARTLLTTSPDLLATRDGSLMGMVWSHWGSVAEVQRWSAKVVTEIPDVAPRMLDSFAHRWRDGNGNVSVEFERDSYDSMLKVINPDVMANALSLGAYRAEVLNETQTKLIGQFQRIHDFVAAERSSVTESLEP